MANKLFAGFGRADITPPMGIPLAGYFKTRLANGVLDPLEVNAIALMAEDKTVLIIAVDHCGLVRDVCELYKKEISEKTGVPTDAIYLHATHTHTAPIIFAESENVLVNEYRVLVGHKAADAALFAISDLAPAKMGFGVGCAPNIAFVRRYRMKDGSVKTNPGVNNPEIDSPMGDVDERVNVLRFTREGRDDIVLANIGIHPDTVGGCKISGDWPAFTRRTLERAIDGVKCIFLNGAEGDVNHVNVFPKGGDLNGMFMDFDDVSRGYDHARFMGRVVAGAVLQVFDKVDYRDVESIRYIQKEYDIASNMPRPEDLPLAHKYNDLHNAGRDDEIPYKAMMLTTVVAEAARMVKLEFGPEFFPMVFSAIAIGNVALFGIPGEPFTGIGRAVKENLGWDLVLPTCNTNAKEGYFPMIDSYNEGGYEARGSNYKAGVAERIIEIAKEILEQIKN